jgi:aspartate aminotransferase
MEMKEAFLKRRDHTYNLLADIPGIKVNLPEGAFYFFPDVSAYFGKSFGDKKITTADDLCLYILDQAHVATVTGDAFGDPNSIRLSYATSEEKLTEAISRISKALLQLG